MVAGDVFEAETRTLHGQLAFADGLVRLAAEGIPTTVVTGNHDPLSGWEAAVSGLASPTGSDATRWGSIDHAGRQEIARIYGISYGRRWRPGTSPPASPGRRRHRSAIGLLHGTIGLTIATSGMRRRRRRSWSLGHGLLGARPHPRPARGPGVRAVVVYPGNPQGRDPGELEPRGVAIVEVDADGVSHPAFVDTDVFRWVVATMDCSALATMSDLLAAIRTELAARVKAADGRSIVVRIDLRGFTPLHDELRMRGWPRTWWGHSRRPVDRGDPFAWLEAIRDETRSDQETAYARGADFIAELDALVEATAGTVAAGMSTGDASGASVTCDASGAPSPAPRRANGRLAPRLPATPSISRRCPVSCTPTAGCARRSAAARTQQGISNPSRPTARHDLVEALQEARRSSSTTCGPRVLSRAHRAAPPRRLRARGRPGHPPRPRPHAHPGRERHGKTTVHQFIHAIFGFLKDDFPWSAAARAAASRDLADARGFEVDPPRGRGHRRRPAARGDRGGGVPGHRRERLVLITGGVTKHVFESVFAFGQDELHDVGRLTKAEVADRIYGASIGVIGDVLKVERCIGGEMDKLWKCREALPAMNRRLTEIERPGRDPAKRATCPGSTAICAGGWRRPGMSGRAGPADRRARRAAPGPGAAPGRAGAMAEGVRGPGGAGDAAEEQPATAEDLAREAALAQAVLIADEAAVEARTAREALDAELAAGSYRATSWIARRIDAAVTAAAAWQSRRADIDERRRQRGAARISIDAVLAEAGWDEARLASADPAQVRASVVAHAGTTWTCRPGDRAPAERARTAAEDVARVQRQLVDLEASLVSPPSVDAAAADELDRQARGLLDDLTRASSMGRDRGGLPGDRAGPGLCAGILRTPGLDGAAGGDRWWQRSVVLGPVLAVAVSPAVGIAVAVLGLVAVRSRHRHARAEASGRKARRSRGAATSPET